MYTYLDDPDRFDGAPRWARHFYALSLRGLGTITRNGDTTVTTFDVHRAEQMEFEELAGVRAISLFDDGMRVRAQIAIVTFAVFEDTAGGDPRKVLTGFASAYDAYRSIETFAKEVPRYFAGEPFVAPENNPSNRFEPDLVEL